MARGYMPGTGRAVFRENALLRLPWDERPICDYPLDDDRFLYPLLCLGENRDHLTAAHEAAVGEADPLDPLRDGGGERYLFIGAGGADCLDFIQKVAGNRLCDAHQWCRFGLGWRLLVASGQQEGSDGDGLSRALSDRQR